MNHAAKHVLVPFDKYLRLINKAASASDESTTHGDEDSSINQSKTYSNKELKNNVIADVDAQEIIKSGDNNREMLRDSAEVNDISHDADQENKNEKDKNIEVVKKQLNETATTRSVSGDNQQSEENQKLVLPPGIRVKRQKRKKENKVVNQWQPY